MNIGNGIRRYAYVGHRNTSDVINYVFIKVGPSNKPQQQKCIFVAELDPYQRQHFNVSTLVPVVTFDTWPGLSPASGKCRPHGSQVKTLSPHVR